MTGEERRWLAQLRWIRRARDYATGWVKHTFAGDVPAVSALGALATGSQGPLRDRSLPPALRGL
jgi:hypothetical protein